MRRKTSTFTTNEQQLAVVVATTRLDKKKVSNICVAGLLWNMSGHFA
jgi:hypothetical protein